MSIYFLGRESSMRRYQRFQIVPKSCFTTYAKNNKSTVDNNNPVITAPYKLEGEMTNRTGPDCCFMAWILNLAL